MFNSQLKNDFYFDYISSRKVSHTSIRATLKLVESFEERFAKDASEFSRDEILSMLSAKNSRSLSSLQNTLSFLRKYTDYVLGPASNNPYRSIKKSDLEQLIPNNESSHVILSRSDIDYLQANMYNAVDKAILECLFLGISGKNLSDLTYLSQNNLDIGTNTLTLASGISIFLSPWQSQLLDNAFKEVEEISYGAEHKTYEVVGYGRLYKERNNVLGGDTVDKRFRWVQRRVMIWKDFFNIPVLTMKTIALSGLVCELQSVLKFTGIELKEYLKTPEGMRLAMQYGFAKGHYVDTIMDKVRPYLP